MLLIGIISKYDLHQFYFGSNLYLVFYAFTFIFFIWIFSAAYMFGMKCICDLSMRSGYKRGKYFICLLRSRER